MKVDKISAGVVAFVIGFTASTLGTVWFRHGTFNVADVCTTLKSTEYRHAYVIKKSKCIQELTLSYPESPSKIDALCISEAHEAGLKAFCEKRTSHMCKP